MNYANFTVYTTTAWLRLSSEGKFLSEVESSRGNSGCYLAIWLWPARADWVRQKKENVSINAVLT